MIVVPLGIASATPTALRHLPALALWHEGSVYLFDCGENAQMSMLQAGLKRSKIDTIFISHFDIDHFSGLIGLIATLQLQRREMPLRLVGPKGLKEYVEWNIEFSGIEIGFDIAFIEVADDIDSAIVVDEKEFFVEARPLKHRRFCLGYRFQEKDKPGKVDAEKATKLGITEDAHFKMLKNGEDVTLADGTVVKSHDIVGHPRRGDSFAYVTDTEYCPNAVKLALNTNILYHEATFSDELADKATETGHSSAKDAARVATEAQTKLLVIGHFSARYTNAHTLLKEAREGFFPTWLANELRPIYTDPTHERGIVKPKVEIKDLTKSENTGRPQGRGRDNNNRSFKPRRSFSTGGGDRNRGSPTGGYRSGGSDRDRYQSRGGSSSGSSRSQYSGSSDNRARYQGSSSRPYSPNPDRDRDRDRRSEDSSDKPNNSRSSYDDFKRF